MLVIEDSNLFEIADSKNKNIKIEFQNVISYIAQYDKNF